MPRLIACPHCDLLIDLPKKVAANEVLSCPRCSTTLIRGQKNPIETAFALSLAAIIFLLCCLPFSYLRLESSGFFNQVGVLDIFIILQRQGFWLLSFFCVLTVLILPSIYLIGILLLVAPLYFNTQQIYPIYIARILTFANHWAMAEVFLLGVFVGLVKLVGLADIVFGIAFFAFFAFVICYIWVINISENLRVWQWARGENA